MAYGLPYKGSKQAICKWLFNQLPPAEWVNSVEYRDCFTAISTNLNGDQIKQKYDQRTYDRIKGNFKVILFKNQSFRKQ